MKYLLIALLSLVLVGCSDHDKVMTQYKNNNPNADELLLHGLNVKNCEHIATHLIDKALVGDEKAKLIIYAQIETLRGLPDTRIRTVPVVVPIQHGRR